MTIWTHPRDITVNIPSHNKFEAELSVTFRVEPDKSTEFGVILENYLNFCYASKAMVRIKDDITDCESHETCAITFEINGERQTVGAELLLHF